MVENSGNHFEHQVRVLNRATGSNRKPAGAYGDGTPLAGRRGKTRYQSGPVKDSIQPENDPHCYPHGSGQGKNNLFYYAGYENSKGDMRP